MIRNLFAYATAFVFVLLSMIPLGDAAQNEISGQVTAVPGTVLKPGGILFVIAKEPGKPMPVAVVRIQNPKFPLKFTISEKNSMMPGTPFKGPFMLTARYSPSGDAMDKSGPEGSESKPVDVGSTNVKIEMKQAR